MTSSPLPKQLSLLPEVPKKFHKLCQLARCRVAFLLYCPTHWTLLVQIFYFFLYISLKLCFHRIQIKTRLQVNKLATSSHQTSSGSQATHLPVTNATSNPYKPSPVAQNLTVAQIVKQIYGDGKHGMLPNAHRTRLYRLVDLIIPQWTPLPQQKPSQPMRQDIWLVKRRRKVLRLSLRLGGMMGFFRGLKPTLLSSFVGSGITMGIFEYVFELLGRRQGSSGIVNDVKLINQTQTRFCIWKANFHYKDTLITKFNNKNQLYRGLGSIRQSVQCNQRMQKVQT